MTTFCLYGVSQFWDDSKFEEHNITDYNSILLKPGMFETDNKLRWRNIESLQTRKVKSENEIRTSYETKMLSKGEWKSWNTTINCQFKTMWYVEPDLIHQDAYAKGAKGWKHAPGARQRDLGWRLNS